MGKFRQKLIDPFIMPVVLIAVIWFTLMIIGRVFISVYQGGDPDRLDRPELWIGVGILLGVIAVMGFLATRPKGALGPLEKDVAVGSRPFFEEPRPALDTTVRVGEPGTVADIREGQTLYASSGAIAIVRGVLPGGVDYGKRFSGFIYAEGMRGVADELWIPYEAVTSVYPEAGSIFLAIKGDEFESFGWTTPPESVSRVPSRHVSAWDKAKDPTSFPRKY